MTVGTRAPRNAQDQASQASTALMKRVETKPFLLPDVVRNALLEQGMTEAQLPTVVASCLAANIPPALMQYPHNIPAVLRVASSMSKYGYLPGEDFHIAIYSANQVVLDEFGEPTGKKEQAPTVVYMPSVGRFQENAKEDARLQGLVIHVEAEPVEDQEEARKIFDLELGGTRAVWGKEVRVARAMLYKYLRNGQSVGSGKAETFYGFYLPYKSTNEKDYVETGKVMANYGPMDIAIKRAKAKAFRSVTRVNFPRDGRTVDQRLAALFVQANNRLSEAEQDAAKFDIDLESAIAGDIPEVKPEHEEWLTAELAGVDLAGKAQSKKMETASGPSDQPVEVSSSAEVATEEELPFTEPAPETEEEVFFSSDDPVAEVAPSVFDAKMGHCFVRVRQSFPEALPLIQNLSDANNNGSQNAPEGLQNLVRGVLEEMCGWESPTSLSGLLVAFLAGLREGDQPSKEVVDGLVKLLIPEMKTKSGVKKNPFYDTSEAAEAREAVKVLGGLIAEEFGQ